VSGGEDTAGVRTPPPKSLILLYTVGKLSKISLEALKAPPVQVVHREGDPRARPALAGRVSLPVDPPVRLIMAAAPK
jgi:hypothetical protein